MNNTYNININLPGSPEAIEKELEKQFSLINKQLQELMKTAEQLTQDLKDILAEQIKTQGEIATLQASSDVLQQKVIDLQNVIDGMDKNVITQELSDAVDAVKAQAQIVDDQIPDVPTPPAS